MGNEMNGMSDTLETVSVLRSAKNFFFFLSIFALLILATIFVFSRIGMLQYPSETPTCYAKPQCSSVEPAGGDIQVPALAATIQEQPTAEEPKEQVLEVVVEQAESATPVNVENIKDQAQQAVEQAVETTELEVAENEPGQIPYDAEAGLKTTKWKLCWTQASILIRVCNTVLVFSLTLFCFTLLIGLKITLVARLAGTYYITSAMFLSMFAMVFFMPWQVAFPGAGLAGAMYTPDEFLSAVTKSDSLTKLDTIVFYGRYAGLWLIVTLSVVMAQGRSMCWVSRCLGAKKG